MADWLLSQKVSRRTGTAKDPEAPDGETLVALARVYLGKAPGMTSHKDVENVTGRDPAQGAGRVPGYPRRRPARTLPPDSDERKLDGPIADKD